MWLFLTDSWLLQKRKSSLIQALEFNTVHCSQKKSQNWKHEQASTKQEKSPKTIIKYFFFQYEDQPQEY